MAARPARAVLPLMTCESPGGWPEIRLAAPPRGRSLGRRGTIPPRASRLGRQRTYRRESGPASPARKTPGTWPARRSSSATSPSPACGRSCSLEAVSPTPASGRSPSLNGQNCRPVERRVSSQLFAPDALVHGARPCAQILSPTLSMPHTCAGCRCHAWQRTPAHAFAFLQRLDHYASSSPISSSGEHRAGQAKIGHRINHHRARTGVVDMLEVPGNKVINPLSGGNCNMQRIAGAICWNSIGRQ